MKSVLAILSSVLMAGCSVVGQNDVETAPYTVIKSGGAEQQFEIRLYDPMVLVSTSMADGGDNSAFRKLFKYITGDNEGETEIAMTAPVIMGEENRKEGAEISMTAPVFMNDNASTPTMSFVMPKDFTLANTPKPNDPAVTVSERKDFKVAAIKFSWTLSDGNVEKHTKLLEAWMSENGLEAKGEAVKAGYNGPLTLPMFRRNEVMIPVE